MYLEKNASVRLHCIRVCPGRTRTSVQGMTDTSLIHCTCSSTPECTVLAMSEPKHLVMFVFQVLNKTKEFEEAVKKVIKDVNLDNDIVVSVFETNIRVLG